MFVERRINKTTGAIELWTCDWENKPGHAARKVYLQRIADEQPIVPATGAKLTAAPAICWSYGRTLGNIAVFAQSVLGSFPGQAGDDAILPCDFVDAGKYRHGVDRWWCRTHQSHWGIKGDLESLSRLGVMLCANRDQPMNYVVEPFQLNLNDFAEIGIWCSMPAAISTGPIQARPPKIHVHVRPEVGGAKTIDRDFDAISLRYDSKAGLFGDSGICLVNVTPPAAFEFVRALEKGQAMDCVDCSTCGYPHLDLGDFARRPHKKHFCANCGRDSTWSKGKIVSTPLQPLHSMFPQALEFVEPDRVLNLDDHPGCTYVLWASTPAIIWTANRPQEKGIHVHVHDGTKRVVDDTFSQVSINGKALSRDELIDTMLSQTII